MSGKQVPCPTAEDALVQALAAAVETLDQGRLAEADFGRFADLNAGWYWRLVVTKEITSEHQNLRGVAGEDSLARRFRVIVEMWKRRVAYYEQGLTPKEDD